MAKELPRTKPKEPETLLRTPKGMHDVLPEDYPYWDRIETAARNLAQFFNFSKIDTPVLEYADLFRRATGEDSDIVEKEMYILKTKGGDVLALRPECTAPVARAYLEHGLSRLGQPQKMYYSGQVFRHNRPQLGRFRQFSQIGFEVIGGPNDPLYDAQLILIATLFLSEIGVRQPTLRMSSIGCKVCKPLYRKQLQAFYKNYEKELCVDCERRFKTNPLRLFDCKRESCAPLKEKAPNLLDKLCATCRAHFCGALEYLDELQIPYALDPQLVRGLDYYSRTVFEVGIEGEAGIVGSVLGGGRYDYLLETLGGHLTPAVGWALGIERLVAVLKAQEVTVLPKALRRVFVVHAGDSAKKKALALVRDLWNRGVPVSEALTKGSLRAQLKTADKEGVRLALIIGQKEIYENSVILRDMQTGLQENVGIDTIVEEIRKRWRENPRLHNGR